MNIKNSLDKLQNLPDKKKKIILWTIVAVIGVVMGYFWVASAITGVSKLREAVKPIDIPSVKLPDMSSLDVLQTITPSNENAIIGSTGVTNSVPPESWKTYEDSFVGITFQYPDVLDNDYVDFLQNPSVMITPESKKSGNIDNNGCFIINLPVKIPDSIAVLGGTKFCLSRGNETMGDGYQTTYDYTTLRNGNYYTLNFEVSKLNCADFGALGDADYQNCVNGEKNYESIVTPLIQKSVSTFKFTK